MSKCDKFFFPDVEWTMCSSEESYQRQRFKELSPFECTNSSYKAHPRDRIPDPNKCVKKYRRSAAGGGVDGHANGHGSGRDLDELELTVNYLLGIIFSAQKSSNGDNDRFSLLHSVLFVDDRIRAVQVDLTTLMGQMQHHKQATTYMNGGQNNNILKIRNIQAKIVRYHLLSQYLLSTLSSKEYEWKFGHKALTTAISSYLATWDSFKNVHYIIDQEKEDVSQLDEIMSYTTLLHVASTIYSREPSIQAYGSNASNQKWNGLHCEDGYGMAAVLGLYRRYASNDKKKCQTHTTLSCFPKYQLALRIAGDVDCGNYLSVIRLLTESASVSLKCTSLDERGRWQILSRCCMSQVMPTLRIGLLRLYNKSFMKQEKVKDNDLANLFHLPNSESAIKFCQNVGLPLFSSASVTTPCIVMKAAPICIQDMKSDRDEIIRQIINPGRDEDYFVFGWLLNRETNRQNIDIQNHELSLPDFDNLHVRTDENAIKVLPSLALRQMIFL